MKNWKCIVGATILAPVLTAILVIVLAGLTWILKEYPLIPIIVLGVSFLFFTAAIWAALYDHCKEYWGAK